MACARLLVFRALASALVFRSVSARRAARAAATPLQVASIDDATVPPRKGSKLSEARLEAIRAAAHQQKLEELLGVDWSDSQSTQSISSTGSHPPIAYDESSAVSTPSSVRSAPVAKLASEGTDRLQWSNVDVQRVLRLMSIMAFGKMIQARFSLRDTGAIQKMLLQFLVPATIFKGLARENMQWSHMAYLGAGVLFVLARIATSLIVSYSALGSSSKAESSKFRRTAMFELSTASSALSVLPFLGEFVGAEYVGLGGMVDLPMKVYMLFVMPALLRQFCETPKHMLKESRPQQKRSSFAALLKDPITLSVIAGVTAALWTDGAGTGALGVFGKTVDALAAAQTPILFLLIGLKLRFQSSMPLYSMVLLLATQGALLVMAGIIISTFALTDITARFMVVFAQGAPSVVGLGVISTAVNSGVQGYSTEFAFDLVGLAFPLSSCMQCVAGIMGQSYRDHAGLVGLALIASAAALRLGFRGRFQEP